MLLFFPGIESDYENRPLSRFPEKLSTDFPKQLEEYYSDNFGLRATYVSLHSYLIQKIFNDSPDPKVISGKDGWLFLEEAASDFMKTNTFDDHQVHRIYRTLKQMSEYLETIGTKFYFTIAPNKNTIYGEYMPDRYVTKEKPSNLRLVSSYLNEKDFEYIDLSYVLTEDKNNTTTYHKKDTHWNNHGAFIAYRKILTDMNLSGTGLTEPSYVVKKDYMGDLQRMLTPAIRINDHQMYFDIQKNYSYTTRFRSFDDILIGTKNSSARGSIIMYRDSFANALIPFISNSFASATYSRQLPYEIDMIGEDPVDFALLEIAERNLSYLLSYPPYFPAIAIPGASNDDYILFSDISDVTIREKNGWSIVNGQIMPDNVMEVYVSVLENNMTVFYEAYTYEKTDEEGLFFQVMLKGTDGLEIYRPVE